MDDAGLRVLDFLHAASVWIFPVVVAATAHELAHAFVADRLGDRSARRAGRLTLNPARHVDLVGTILVPMLFVVAAAPLIYGYAKPVPVGLRALRKPERDVPLIAAAGPAANLGLFFFSTACLAAIGPEFGRDAWVVDLLRASIIANLVLVAINLIPIPPLDGGRIAVWVLPHHLGVRLNRIERYGLVVAVLVVASGALYLPHAWELPI